MFCVAVAIVHPLDGEDIFKNIACRFKTYTMITPITGSLIIVPFKLIILHKILLSSSFVNCLALCSISI